MLYFVLHVFCFFFVSFVFWLWCCVLCETCKKKSYFGGRNLWSSFGNSWWVMLSQHWVSLDRRSGCSASWTNQDSNWPRFMVRWHRQPPFIIGYQRWQFIAANVLKSTSYWNYVTWTNIILLNVQLLIMLTDEFLENLYFMTTTYANAAASCVNKTKKFQSVTNVNMTPGSDKVICPLALAFSLYLEQLLPNYNHYYFYFFSLCYFFYSLF